MKKLLGFMLCIFSTMSFAQPGSRVCAAYTTNDVVFEGQVSRVATVVEVPKDNFFDWLEKFDFVRDLGVTAAGVMGFGEAAEVAARANVEIVNLVKQTGIIKETNKCPDKMMGVLTNALAQNVSPHQNKKVSIDLKVFTSCEELGRALDSKKKDVCDRLKRSANSTSFLYVPRDTRELNKIKFKDFKGGVRRSDYR